MWSTDVWREPRYDVHIECDWLGLLVWVRRSYAAWYRRISPMAENTDRTGQVYKGTSTDQPN